MRYRLKEKSQVSVYITVLTYVAMTDSTHIRSIISNHSFREGWHRSSYLIVHQHGGCFLFSLFSQRWWHHMKTLYWHHFSLQFYVLDDRKGPETGLCRTSLIASLVPRPFLYGRDEKGEGRQGLVNNSTPTRIRIQGISLMFNNC